MSISMYEITIPVLKLGLTNLAAILDKATAHAELKKFDVAALVQARLFPDMYPLIKQVQICCDTAKGAAARLAGIEIPKHPDTESTIPELKLRIGKTLDFVTSVKPEQLMNSESREIVMQFPSITMKFTGINYVTNFVTPNFYFHSSMAYALLRKNGVEVSKADFLGAIL